MYLRHDRVLLREQGDDHRVYSLILNDEGLYIIRTGNAGGIITDPHEPGLNQVALDETTQPLIEEVVNNEAKLKDTPPSQLVNQPDSLFLPFHAIRSAVASTENVEPVLYLKTVQGDFNFVFTYSTGKQVEELHQALNQHSAA